MSTIDDLRYIPRLGLALGGGGALGAAHVGVLQVLHERGIVPSIITGTSAGAIAGGAAAVGIDPYDLEDHILRWGWSTFGSWTPKPGFGLLTHDALAEGLKRTLGMDPLVEDLPTRFAAVATDIDAREAVVIDHGSLTKAVAASIAVPGIFRPVTIDGKTLLDGGLVQNVPIQACIELGAEHVIAVRLSAEWDLRGFETGLEVHEWEIRSDVTVLNPRVGAHSQWAVKGLKDLVRLGREAAEAEFEDYPILHERPQRPIADDIADERHAAATAGDASPDVATTPGPEGGEMPPLRHLPSAFLRRR